MIKGFTDQTITLNGVDISFSRGGSGPPLLLLHGFPQTRSMWAAIAPALAESREVVCPDLPGYGLSSKPHDVKAYSFRNMAAHQIGLMRHLGHGSFDVAGHDRGGRVAHRMALDSPEAVNRLCVMDIVPTHTLLTDLRMDVAHGYYHWFFMSQPEPFPEKMIERNPDFYYESCLLGWGASKLEEFNQLQVAAYRKSWNNPDAIRGMCNDYRAAIKYDVHDDEDDLWKRIACGTLVLYGDQGVMARIYDVPETWLPKCEKLASRPIKGGHFFPDTNPTETIESLSEFFHAE